MVPFNSVAMRVSKNKGRMIRRIAQFIEPVWCRLAPSKNLGGQHERCVAIKA